MENVRVVHSPAGKTRVKIMLRMRMLVLIGAFLLVALMAAFASQQEDRVADSVAAAFVQGRDSAHLPRLARMGQNTFREKACGRDLRLASGVILTVQYQTSDPGQLPEAARQLAAHPDDGSRVTTRFGVGVSGYAVNQELQRGRCTITQS